MNFEYWSNNELPETWSETTIDKFIYIVGRIELKGVKAQEYTESGPLFLSVYNLNYADLSRTYHLSKERYDESPEIHLQNEDILLAKDGAWIGKLGYVKGLECKATINSSLLLIRAADFINPKFLFRFLEALQMQEIVKRI